MTVTPIRDEFDDQFAALCAAFDRGYTADRREAFRTSFVGKLSVVQVARMVERLVGEYGPEKMPTVREMWQTFRALKARGGPAGADQEHRPAVVWSRWHQAANAAMFFAAIAHPGKDSRAGWQLARRLGDQFEALGADGDPEATFDAMKAAMLREYARLPEGLAA